MSLHIFNDLESFWKYVEETSGYSRTIPSQYGEWSKAMQEIQKSAKYSENFDQFGRYSGVIDDSIKENYVGVGAQVSTSGGVKSAPSIESVYTESGSGTAVKTAVKTETAKGLQTRGPIGMTPVMNVVSGIAAAMGLYHIGITISNWRSWRDMFNDVFDADLGPDADFNDVVDFGKSRIQLYFTGVWDYTSTYVPEHIVKKLYAFFGQHMQASGSHVSEFYDAGMFMGLPAFVRIQEDGPYYRLAAVASVDPQLYNIRYTEFSDNLLQNQMTDFLSQLVGGGMSVADSVSEFLINNMQGVYNAIAASSENARELLTNANRVNVLIGLQRGSGVPKTQPISASEIRVGITLYNDPDFVVDSQGSTMQVMLKEDRVYGCKGLKPGRTGGEQAYADYGYLITNTYLSDKKTDLLDNLVTFPSNQRNIATYVYANRDISAQQQTGMGGWSLNYDVFDYAQNIDRYNCNYSNFSYTGSAQNYEPDEYLLLAGWQRRNTTDKLPEPNTTVEQGYTEWFHKRQQVAQPDKNNNNTDSYYMPVTVPNGMNNANDITENGYNPSGQNQNYIQSGKMPGTTNIDDVNDDIGEAVEQYNKSDTTIDSAPNPIPETEPNPQYPETPPTEPGGDSGDTPDPGLMPGVTASGMVSVYNPTKAEIISFSGWLWSTSVMENLKRLLADPMDAIIGLHVMYATPDTGTPENIIAGYLDSQVPAKVVTKQFTEISCGSVVVPEFYGNVFDYEPYTQIHMYLPFVGIVAIKANDVVGKKVTVKYGIDVLTGTCLAMVNTEKGESNIQCYQFAGNCAVQIPLTGGNYAGIIRSLASMAVGVAGSVLTGNPLPAIGGVIGGAMGASLDVSHSGSLGANAGVLGIRKPYIIITRRIAYEAQGYNQFYGFPANLTVTLGSCKGYTRVKSVHIDSISKATDTEKTEIETLLRQGVIIK